MYVVSFRLDYLEHLFFFRVYSNKTAPCILLITTAHWAAYFLFSSLCCLLFCAAIQLWKSVVCDMKGGTKGAKNTRKKKSRRSRKHAAVYYAPSCFGWGEVKCSFLSFFFQFTLKKPLQKKKTGYSFVVKKGRGH
jgi:hypothetical protein